MDTKRTHSTLNFFQKENPQIKIFLNKKTKNHDIISRILYIWGKINPTVRYVQGYILFLNQNELNIGTSVLPWVSDSEQVLRKWGVFHVCFNHGICYRYAHQGNGWICWGNHGKNEVFEWVSQGCRFYSMGKTWFLRSSPPIL